MQNILVVVDMQNDFIDGRSERRNRAAPAKEPAGAVLRFQGHVLPEKSVISGNVPCSGIEDL